MSDDQRVFRIASAGTDHGIDVHVEVGVFLQELQLLVEDFEAFHGDFVGLHVVDGYLQVVEAGSVERLDALDGQQISVGDESSDRADLANARDNALELRMQQWLAAGDGDEAYAEASEMVDATLHLFGR